MNATIPSAKNAAANASKALLCTMALALVGCNNEDDQGLSAFNLLSIEAANTSATDDSGDVRQMTLTWDSAGRSASTKGITYTLCQADTSADNNCAALASVSDTTSATVQLESLLTAVSSRYFVIASRQQETQQSSELSLSATTLSEMIGYFKASNTTTNTKFGYAAAMSADGYTFVIGAPYESSAATGINGDANYSDETADDADYAVNYAASSGAVYVFRYFAGSWRQSAYIKAANAEAGDQFGYNVALSADGTSLAVSANSEDSDGSAADNNEAARSGAVYVFTLADDNWQQTAYLKASNAGANDYFGNALSINDNGDVIAVGATGEDSAATGIYSDVPEETATVSGSGAVYLFTLADNAWSQSTYIKASNNDGSKTNDQFGYSVALDAAGEHLIVGAPFEDSNAQGINGDASDNSASKTGAAYFYRVEQSDWAETAYIKAANSDADYTANFGHAVAINDDGSVLAVSAYREDLAGSGINPEPSYEEDGTTLATNADTGAAYLFSNDNGSLTETAYIKASNPKANDRFGFRLALSSTGTELAVSAYHESSAATGLNDYSEVIEGDEAEGTEDVNYADNAGAVYLFKLSNNEWTETTYVKASNTSAGDTFGHAIAINDDASALVVGAYAENSATTGINGEQQHSAAVEDDDDNVITEAVNYASKAGAVYLY